MTAKTIKMPLWLQWGLALFVFISMSKAVYVFATDSAHFQWDSLVYFKSPQTWMSGGNPYILNGFVYPPLTLLPLRLLSLLLSAESNVWVYLVLKVTAFVGIVATCKKSLFPKAPLALIAFIAWFSFYGTLFLDFRAGNIGTFEVLLVTVAFAFFLKRNYLACGLLIALCACFKITPLVFLALLITEQHDKYKARKALLVSVALFVVYILANRIFYPQESYEFIRQSLGRAGEGGVVAPSFFALFREYTSSVSVQMGIYVLFTAFVLFFTVRRYLSREHVLTRLELCVLTSLTYGLIMPRLKDYGFGFMIPAAIYIFLTVRPEVTRGLLLAVLAVFSLHVPIPPMMNQLSITLWNYMPSFQVLLLWALFVFGGVTYQGQRRGAVFGK